MSADVAASADAAAMDATSSADTGPLEASISEDARADAGHRESGASDGEPPRGSGADASHAEAGSTGSSGEGGGPDDGGCSLHHGKPTGPVAPFAAWVMLGALAAWRRRSPRGDAERAARRAQIAST